VYVQYNCKYGTFGFGWPLPDPALILDITIISDRWKAAIESFSSPAITIPQLAVFFLELMIETAASRQPISAEPRAEPDKEAWKELARKLVLLMEPVPALPGGLRTTRQLDFADWARDRAGLLGAPESGLPPETARAFLDSLLQETGTEKWPSVAAELLEARNKRARYALSLARGTRPQLELTESQLLAEIDNEFQNSPWELVKKAAPPWQKKEPTPREEGERGSGKT